MSLNLSGALWYFQETPPLKSKIAYKVPKLEKSPHMFAEFLRHIVSIFLYRFTKIIRLTFV